MIRLAVGRVGRSGRVDLLEKRVEVARVGEGVGRTGRLARAPLERAIRVLRRFRSIAASHGAGLPQVVATAAFRQAANRAAAVRSIERRTGLSVEIIDGDREARLALAGIRTLAPRARKIALIDVGGASTELVVATRRHVVAESFPIGVIALAERGTREASFADAAARAFAASRIRAPRGAPCFAAGGAALAFAAWRDGARYLQFGGGSTTLSVDGLARLARRFASVTKSVAARRLGIATDHARLIEPGHAILVAAMRSLRVARVRPTDRGVAEGLLAELLSGRTRGVHR